MSNTTDEMKTKDDFKKGNQIPKELIEKRQFVLILIFALVSAVFAGFVTGSMSRYRIVGDRILLSGGLLLSFTGVTLMILSMLHIDPNGSKWMHRDDVVPWMFNFGWAFLVLGLTSQFMGIWLL